MSNGFHRSCNPTIQKFFEDFDMLPSEMRHMLMYQNSTPAPSDLKAAWELVAETGSLSDLIHRVNVLQPTKEEKEAARLAKIAEKKRLKEEAARQKYRKYTEYRPVYGKPRLKEIDPKQARLVTRVTEEQAMEMLARRKENADVKQVSLWERPIVAYQKVVVTVDPNTIPPEKPSPPQHLIKMMHNAGGKK